jgi:SAM-dependent methyltransferase
MAQPTGREQFFTALQTAVADNALVKLVLGKYRGDDPTLKKLTVRPVQLQAGPHLCFVWRHQQRDITKNLPVEAALTELETWVGPSVFCDAHLFTALQTAQLATAADGATKVRFKIAHQSPGANSSGHNRAKTHLINARAGWLQDLGITNPQGQPRAGQSAKFRQIQRFAETFTHQFKASGLEPDDNLRISDMGSGKGYLTFALAELLGPTARLVGIEQREDLVRTCNQVARSHGLNQLTFQTGKIETVARDLDALDVLIALHACDTATDDALAAGIAAGARLLIVAPCCQHELRPQLQPPPVLAPALRHGIFQERHAEFVTDALRALLLEAMGFETRVFEFISTEHTAKNLMLAAWRNGPVPDSPRPAAVKAVQELAAFYGITHHALAQQLQIPLAAS